MLLFIKKKTHKKYNEIYVTIEANTWRRLTNFSLVIWIRKWHPPSLMSNSNQLVHNGLFCHYRGIDDSLKSNYLQCTTNLIHACTDHFLLVILGVHARCILSALRVGPWDVVRHCHGLGTERERLWWSSGISWDEECLYIVPLRHCIAVGLALLLSGRKGEESAVIQRVVELVAAMLADTVVDSVLKPCPFLLV